MFRSARAATVKAGLAQPTKPGISALSFTYSPEKRAIRRGEPRGRSRPGGRGVAPEVGAGIAPDDQGSR